MQVMKKQVKHACQPMEPVDFRHQKGTNLHKLFSSFHIHRP
jgi:hypothetical protein